MRAVIFGPSSCGKSETLRLLSEEGYQTHPEVPREVLDNQNQGENGLNQLLMWKLQSELESKHSHVILERGLPDIYIYTGHYAPDFLHMLLLNEVPKYDVAFHLDSLPGIDFHEKNRIESGLDEARLIDDKILDLYNNHAKEIRFIKTTDRFERVKLISEDLQELGFYRNTSS